MLKLTVTGHTQQFVWKTNFPCLNLIEFVYIASVHPAAAAPLVSFYSLVACSLDVL